MAAEPGFRTALTRHIRRGTALVAATDAQTDPLGGLLFTPKPPAYHVRWLVVAEHARGTGAPDHVVVDTRQRSTTGQLQLIAVIGDVIEAFAVRAGALLPDLLQPPPDLARFRWWRSGRPGRSGRCRRLRRRYG